MKRTGSRSGSVFTCVCTFTHSKVASLTMMLESAFVSQIVVEAVVLVCGDNASDSNCISSAVVGVLWLLA